MATIKALTQKHVKAFEKYGRQDGMDAKVILKMFLPINGFYWFFTELETDPDSPDYGIGFGFANLNDPQCAELGSIDLFELLNLNRKPQIDRSTDLTTVRIGGPEARWKVVERDIHFKIGSMTIGQVMERVSNNQHV